MKILIIKLGALGDVINTFPAVIRLKHHFNADIHWLVAPLSFPLVKNHPCVDKAILFDKTQKHGLHSAIKSLRQNTYDIAFDFQRTLKSGFFCLISKSREKLGFDKKRCKELTWLYPFTRIPPSDPGKHMVDQYLDFTDYLGIKDSSITWNIPRYPLKNDNCSINENEQKKGIIYNKLPKKESLKINLPDKYIILNIGATKKANLWPVEHFGILAQLIHSNTKFTCVLTGGGKCDRERAVLITDLTNELTAEKLIINLVDETNIMELVEIIDNAALVVSCDTGPMHLSIALGKKTIALFGPSDPRRTGPYMGRQKNGVVIAKSLPCTPCNKRACKNPMCMEMITPKEVFQKIIETIH